MTVRPIPRDGAGHGPASDAELGPGDRALARELLDGLRRAPGHGFTVSEIARLLDCSERKVRTLVTLLRRRGEPICATPDAGYFWPRTREEAGHTLAFLTARIHSTAEVRTGIRRGLDELFGADEQLTLAEVA